MEITIAIDAMGGDHGPHVTVPAALKAIAKDDQLNIVLVGLEDAIQAELKAHKETKDLPKMSSLPEPKGLMATPKDSHTKAKTNFKEPEAYKGKLPTRKKVVPVDVSYAPLVEQFTDKLADIEQRRNIGREKLLDRLE